jgi:ABC-type transporter Mla subunit MlaD
MPVQDLTPQLRTRLSRVERAVGLFVILATVLLLAGFSYYVYHTAQNKGWFLTKLPYHTFVNSAEGLRVGDPVMLMGFDVGQVSRITAMPPGSTYGNVYIEFIVREPFYGYIWTDSYVRVTAADFLGKRSVELIEGGTSGEQDVRATYQEDENGRIIGVWNRQAGRYVAFTPESKGYTFDPAQESPAVTTRLEQVANQVQQALPGILDMTNHIVRVLTNTAQLTSTAREFMDQAQPIASNLVVISSSLTNGQGALGEWLLPPELSAQLEQTLASASATMDSANTNVAMVAANLNQSLENLANITSNLNVQVQANDAILSQVSAAVTNANAFVQGLRGHWLLRSAFRGDADRGGPESRDEFPAQAPRAGPRTGRR